MIVGLRRLSDLANRVTELVLVPIVAFFTILIVVSVSPATCFSCPLSPRSS